MEEKGIVLRELSCRTAAELPPPELLDCHRSFGVSPAHGARLQSGSSAPGGAPPAGAARPLVHKICALIGGGGEVGGNIQMPEEDRRQGKSICEDARICPLTDTEDRLQRETPRETAERT
ncbi:unnamed protein product [Boreogadus saida]